MKFSNIQLEALNELKKSTAWGIILEKAKDFVDKECDLEKVGDTLPDNEYKIECQARKKAKEMFTSIFNEIKTIDKEIDFTKKDYS